MTIATDTEEPTLLEAITRRLRACLATPDGVESPAAILWTDPGREWAPLIDPVRVRLPELLILGDYDPERRTGPAIWLRCVVEGTVAVPGMPEGSVPILYLPGIGRQQLRAGEDCPRRLQPLVELMYRGALWLHPGGHDWTLTAFLASPKGLGLDLARDERTLEAVARAVREVAETPLGQLAGRRLEADDFDRLLTTDLYRDLLRWMSDPAVWRERIGVERWGAFRSQCRTQLRFDPDVDGEFVAGQRLGEGSGAWAEVWARFEEAPLSYSGIPELLRRSKPSNLFVDRSRWPDENEAGEGNVRSGLEAIGGLPHVEACARILQLETEHAERRGWVWSRMGLAPLAAVLEPLAVLAIHARTTLGGTSPEEIGHTYAAGPWRADAASWRAMALVPAADEAFVHRVIRCLLEPWLDESARVFQRAVETIPFPTRAAATTVEAPEGGCLLFADGLRYDLGQLLAERLEGRGCRVQMGHRWAALPTVTATAKPAVTPVATQISGSALPEDFAPSFVSDGRPATASRIRMELERVGYQLLGGELADWPASETTRGWSEDGQIDSLGHKLAASLARQLDDQLDRLADRVVALLDWGWSSVRIVTDHGWLLMPGGLPKIDLPKHLTASRWARCATVAGDSRVSAPTAPWYWNPQERFATAPGIACFNVSSPYSHGGISIQECLTPDLHVERAGGGKTRVTIESLTWRGMRCIVTAAAGGQAVQADLRLGAAHGPSIAASVKTLDADGRASLVVDDEHEGADVTLILLDPDGAVLAQRTTRVGEAT